MPAQGGGTDADAQSGWRRCGFFALLFVVSLTRNLYGAVAVVTAILFFAVLSALTDSRRITVILILRLLGWLFVVAGVLNLPFPTNNKVFAGTLVACGTLLAISRLSGWVVGPDVDASK